MISSRTRTTTRTAVLAGVVGLLGLAALAGCGNAGTSGASGGSAAASDAGGTTSSLDGGKAQPSEDGPLGFQADSSAAQSDGGGATSDVMRQRIIKNGDVAITTPDPQQARDRVDRLLISLRGSLDDEKTVYDKQGQIHDSTLVLRVPVASFDVAMSDLQHLGTVVHSNSTGQDVTNQVIDVQQRLRTLRISLRELNSFQSHAANIDQLLRFENAITVRRGQYQSLKAQRNHLLSQTSMSTIDLDISVPPTKTSPAEHHRATGFLTGLRNGWSAFTGTIMVALMAFGAILPFALVLAVIGVPLWWWTRRRPGSEEPAQAAPAD